MLLMRLIPTTRAFPFVLSLTWVENVRILRESSIATQNLGSATNTRVTRLKIRWSLSVRVHGHGPRRKHATITHINCATLTLYAQSHAHSSLTFFRWKQREKYGAVETIAKRFQDIGVKLELKESHVTRDVDASRSRALLHVRRSRATYYNKLQNFASSPRMKEMIHIRILLFC